LLDQLLAHPFLQRGPPKSTGRDTFGEAYVDSVLQRASGPGAPLAPADVLATAAELVARHVADALARHGPANLRQLVVCGGGARHAGVMDALERLVPCPVVTGSDAGVDPDAREALVFAVLGARCALGLPSTDAVTGAAPGRVLGKLSHPCVEVGERD
jgi:anhydro-N-acetylmuramic acid kinase